MIANTAKFEVGSYVRLLKGEHTGKVGPIEMIHQTPEGVFHYKLKNLTGSWNEAIVEPIASASEVEQHRQQWEQKGGLKFDQDKPRMELLDSEAIEQLALVLTFGAKKYAADNWRKGISYRRLIAAALRHLFAYLRGEDNDPETGLPHPAHAMCCCMFMIWMAKHRRDQDDRNFNEGEKTNG